MTEVAGYTQTAAVTTPTSTRTPYPTLTPVGFDLFPTLTTFEASSLCPDGVWDTGDLEPSWALACSHCFARPTSTPNPEGIPDFGVLPQFEIAQLGFNTFTPLPPTATPGSPTPTSTATPTITPTPTTPPCWVPSGDPGGVRHLVISWDCPDPLYYTISSGTVVATGYSGNGYYKSNGDLIIDVYLPPQHGYYAMGMYIKPNNGALSYGLYYQIKTWGGGWSALTQLGGYLTGGAWNWKYHGGWTQNNVEAVRFYYQSNTHTTGVTIDEVDLGFYGDYYTPTPNWTNTPTNTPTPTNTIDPSITPLPSLTSTPARGGSLLQADCRTPVYVSHDRPVNVDIQPTTSTCLTIVPPIAEQDILTFHIDGVRQVDLCLIFYEVTFQVLGIVIDIPLMVTVAFAFVIIRWALSS